MHVGMATVFQNVWGTPEQCYEKIVDTNDARTGNSHYVGVISYSRMPYDELEGDIRLFAREVMPELEKLEPRAGADRAGVATEPRVNGGLWGS